MNGLTTALSRRPLIEQISSIAPAQSFMVRYGLFCLSHVVPDADTSGVRDPESGKFFSWPPVWIPARVPLRRTWPG